MHCSETVVSRVQNLNHRAIAFSNVLSAFWKHYQPILFSHHIPFSTNPITDMMLLPRSWARGLTRSWVATFDALDNPTIRVASPPLVVTCLFFLTWPYLVWCFPLYLVHPIFLAAYSLLPPRWTREKRQRYAAALTVPIYITLYLLLVAALISFWYLQWSLRFPAPPPAAVSGGRSGDKSGTRNNNDVLIALGHVSNAATDLFQLSNTTLLHRHSQAAATWCNCMLLACQLGVGLDQDLRATWIGGHAKLQKAVLNLYHPNSNLGNATIHSINISCGPDEYKDGCLDMYSHTTPHVDTREALVSHLAPAILNYAEAIMELQTFSNTALHKALDTTFMKYIPLLQQSLVLPSGRLQRFLSTRQREWGLFYSFVSSKDETTTLSLWPPFWSTLRLRTRWLFWDWLNFTTSETILIAMLKEMVEKIQELEPHITRLVSDITETRNKGKERTIQALLSQSGALEGDDRFRPFLDDLIQVWEIEPEAGYELSLNHIQDTTWSDVVRKTWQTTFLSLWKEAVYHRIMSMQHATKENIERRGRRTDQVQWIHG